MYSHFIWHKGYRMRELESIGEPLYNDKNDKNLIIEKPSYNAESKRLFINKSLYFDKVDSSVWEYKIGGYQVLDKYLKSHKDEEINFEYFQKIIQTLHKSLEIEKQIAKISFARYKSLQDASFVIIHVSL